MSSDLKYKQVSNVERRTWDKETYAARAKARAEAEERGEVLPDAHTKKGDNAKEDEKEEFTPAAEGAAGPEKSDRAFLKARTGKVDIDSKIGTSEMVSAEVAATSGTGDVRDGVVKTGVGWHCKVCDCFLKDSHAYLDHINGRKHQRKLGYSMRIERSTTEQVQDRLAQLIKSKAKKDEPGIEVTAIDRVKAKDDELRKLKEDRIKRREERKKKVQQRQAEEEEEEPQIDPAMAAMMGFGGFGGGNKNI